MSADPLHPARYGQLLPDGRLECRACPRHCRLHEGQRGFCFVRARVDDALVLTTYGRSSGLCLDPIEKKPLSHFFPGTSVLSLGTAGCNLGCRFCQNYDISTARRMDVLQQPASPAGIAEAAAAWGARSVAFTYNDPVIFSEYAIDVATRCRAQGIKTVAVTAGYVDGPARVDLFAAMDAANVDLKGFTEDFYVKHTGGAHLAPVLETLAYLVHETNVWLEITTLLIPGLNDGDDELRAMTHWIATELGPDVPHHFSAFHPAHKMPDTPRTELGTLRRARAIAHEAGLRYVYTGNVHHPPGERTDCAGCGRVLIERDRYRLLRYDLTSRGTCPGCGQALPGRFDPRPGDFGPRRVPVRIDRTVV